MGSDCNICGHAFIETGAVVGDRVTVKNSVVIWDGVVIEDDVFIGPGAVFTNVRNPRAAVRVIAADFSKTLVRAHATIGANSTLVAGITVGVYAFVAAGSVVTRNVLAHEFVAGNPARQIGWACFCGERLGDDMTCVCGERFVVTGTGVMAERGRGTT